MSGFAISATIRIPCVGAPVAAAAKDSPVRCGEGEVLNLAAEFRDVIPKHVREVASPYFFRHRLNRQACLCPRGQRQPWMSGCLGLQLDERAAQIEAIFKTNLDELES